MSKHTTGFIGGGIVAAGGLIALLAPVLSPYDPLANHLETTLMPPGGAYWLGTDELGRDVLSRLLYGSRYALIIGVTGMVAGLICGVPWGMIAAYFRGKTETLLMRVVDVLLAFPGILLALAIISVLGTGVVNVVVAVGLFSMPTFARISHGAVIAVREMPYVEAAMATGCRTSRILFIHILPNTLAPVFVQASLRIGAGILVAAGLSFLGLGVQPPTPEWGAMLSRGRMYVQSAPWLAVAPGLCIMVMVMGFNLLGDYLRDRLDPRMRGEDRTYKT
ncbi:MAG: ABC transporter permease [candidate division Zixibacteria bacterium]|nr:ABC transporter permease [candidate division Zixibacteria bacterium]